MASSSAGTGTGESERKRARILVGETAQGELRELLSKTNPMKAVAKFAKDNSLGVAGSQPALDLLSLGLKKTRLESHKAVLATLKKRLLDRIQKTEEPKKLNDILKASFPYISVEELREVPVAVMLKMQNIPRIFKESMCRDKDLLKVLPPSLFVLNFG